MRTNEAGLSLIKNFEGFSPTPYLCPVGVWTIGYGHTQGINKNTAAITEAEAGMLLAEDVGVVEAYLARLVRAPLSDNQFSALVSFVFNIGAGAFARSTMLKKINTGHDASGEFLRWVLVAGERSKGLENRRRAEQKLYMEEL